MLYTPRLNQGKEWDDPMVPDSIVIDGTRQRVSGNRGERLLVLVDRQKILLQPVVFRFFAILGLQLLLDEDDGWVQTSTLYRPAEIVARYIYRMKQSIYNAVPRLQSWRVVENDRRGSYRLLTKPDSVTVNPVNLYEFGDHDLERMVDKLVAIARGQPSYR